MSRIHGKGSKVYLGVGTGSATPLSNAADWSLDIKFATADGSQLGDDWVQLYRGQGSWSGSINGPLETTSSSVWDATIATQVGPLYIYPNWKVDNGATYYYGTAWFEASVKGGVAAMVTFTGTVTGLGPLTSYP